MGRNEETTSFKGCILSLLVHITNQIIDQLVRFLVVEPAHPIAPGFKNKIRYAPYMRPGSQISHIATNKGNIERQCSIYNVLSIKDITLDSRQRKDNSDL